MLALLALPLAAHALDCEEILGMLDVGIPEDAVAATVSQLSGELTRDDLACLERARAPQVVLDAAVAALRRTSPRPVEEPPPPPTAPPPKPPPAEPSHGLTCAEVHDMLAIGVPRASVQATVAELGGITDGDAQACLAGVRVSSSRAAPEAPVPIAEDPLPACLAHASPAPLAPVFPRDVDGALADDNLCAAVELCSAWQALLDEQEATPATTPSEEDQRIEARDRWRSTCEEASVRAAACVRDSLRDRGLFQDRHSAIAAADALTTLVRALEGSGVLEDAPSRFDLEAAVLATPAPAGDTAGPELRAKHFREALFQLDWVRAASLLDEERRWADHRAEAAVLVGRRPRTPLAEDPWSDMGLTRARARMPWLHAADTLAATCASVELPEGKGPKRLIALLATAAEVEAVTTCYGRALRYAEHVPAAPELVAYEQAAGLGSPDGPRDRLQSTAVMAMRVHREARAQVEEVAAMAETALAELKEQLPRKVVDKVEAAQERPEARCAVAAARVERGKARARGLDDARVEAERLAERIRWWDTELFTALAEDLDVARAELEAASAERNDLCVDAARKP